MKIAVALGNMNSAAWLDTLRATFAQAGLPATLVEHQGQGCGARYAVVWMPPDSLFATERDLRAVFNVGAGVEKLLALAALPPQLPVLRLVDAGMAPKMAEYVCFALARITRGLHRFGSPQPLRDWNADRPRGTPPTVGVMGLGAIGATIARAVTTFGYQALGWSRSPRAMDGVRCFAGADELEPFLARTNVLVDVLPLTAETENLLNAKRLAQLPGGAHVINIGRGATIVDEDLLAALDNGHLASATLDVFRVEPLPSGHPFWFHPKITVTPHLSGPTPREPAAQQIASAIAQLESGVPAASLPGFVERARGY